MKLLSFSSVKLFSGISLLALLLLTCNSTAFAHRIRIFAYSDGDNIICEAMFNNNRPAQNSAIEVYRGDNLLLSGTTDKKGLFSFKTPKFTKSQNLRITVNSGDGHQAEWLLLSEDYQNLTSIPQDSLQEASQKSSTRLDKADELYVLSKQEIHHLIEQEVSRQLAPIKRKLAAQKEASDPSARDILAGIGIIFGLMGLVTYFNSRKKRKDNV